MSNDIARGIETAHVHRCDEMHRRIDFASWHTTWTCFKWSEEACDWVRGKLGLASDAEVRSAMFEALALRPDLGIDVVEGNVLCNAGIQRMEDLLFAGGGQAYDATHSRILTGIGTTAAAATDTDLSAATGATNRYCAMVNSVATRSGQVVTFVADFTTSNANFHWQEWGIDQGTAAGTGAATAPLLNHKVEDLGTKTVGTWTLSGAITIT